jgi:hypothetical protein
MRKYKVNEEYFDVLNENSAYWLGFLYADGYVRLRNGRSGTLKLKLKDTDRNHIEKFLNDIDSDHPIKCGIDGKSKFCLTSVNSNKMVKRLFELGCVNNKTFKIRLPDLTQNLMSHFIRGYFDGDGSISKVKNTTWYRCSICGNKFFIYELLTYLNTYGLFGCKIYTQGKINILTIANLSDIFKFKKLLYGNNENMLYLERKKIIFDDVKTEFVSKEEFLKLINEKKFTTLNQYKSYISFNRLNRFPRNPESEYNFKF